MSAMTEAAAENEAAAASPSAGGPWDEVRAVPLVAGSRADAVVAAVAGWVAEQTVPVVVVGDLNATPWSHPFRELQRATGLRDGKNGFGLQPTYLEGTGPLMVPLDHLLHDPAVTLTEGSTGPALGSTHRSLQATLGWSADVPTPPGGNRRGD